MKRIALNIAAIILLIAFFSQTGLGNLIDNKVSEARFSAMPRAATGSIAFIAIDHKSLKAINKWPWPRSTHARLIKALLDYEVSEMAFDIDFSSKSTVSEDQALLEALQNAKNSVILATFRQKQKSPTAADKIVNNAPLQIFQDHSWLASVNVYPARNGLIDSMPFGHSINGEFIPSLSAMLTGTYKPEQNDFIIDYGINSQTIPQYSYIDVLEKRVNQNLLKGRKVIIGASATELGDLVFIPGQGIVEGPLLQILAAETLLQNRELKELSPVALWAGVALLLGMFFWLFNKFPLGNKITILLMSALAIESVAFYAYHAHGLMAHTAHWQFTLLAYFLMSLLTEIDINKLMAAITERQLNETRQIIEQVFHDSYTAAVVANEDGTIRAVSRTVPTLLKSADGVIFKGNHYRHCLPMEIAATADKLLATTDHSQGLIHHSDRVEYTPDEQEPIILEYTVTVSPLKQKNKSSIAEKKRILTFAIQDITSRHNAEQAQKAATEAAIQSDRAKSEFLSNISHELRTPLNSILGFSELIEQQALGPDKLDDYSDFARDIKQSGQQLLRVVNDIIHVTRVESGDINFNEEECDTLDLIEYAIEDVSLQFRGLKLNIAMEHEENLPLLKADAKICHEILTAIISNAIKFSDENEEILIRARQNKDHELCITIKDHGTGISRSELKNIFKPFYQIESDKNRQFEGTGLGLTKANAYMRKLAGNLKVASSLGQGTTIYLTFPKERCVAQANSVISLQNGPDHFLKSA